MELMKLKKLLALLTAVAVLLTCLTACGSSSDTEESKSGNDDSSETLSLSETAGAGYSSDNDTKVKQMLEKVTLNGEPLSIPYTVDDLPEGFTLDEDVNIYTNDEGEEFVYSIIRYDDIYVSSAEISDYYDGQPTEEFKICAIGFGTSTEDEFEGWIQIDGITDSSTMDEVLEKFGEPTSYEFADNTTAYYYKTEEQSYISFIGNKEGEILHCLISN